MTARLITDFREPGKLVDDELRLVLAEWDIGDAARGRCPAYRFAMRIDSVTAPVGRIELRLGATEFLVRYAGQIGYGVSEPHRGHRYAARSVRLLFPLARTHNLDELWITTTPDNVASRRTCELAGAELVEVVDLPAGNDMYDRGERQKCRYLIRLDAAA